MMNRRTSIKRLVLLSVAFVTSLSIWRWFMMNAEPQLDYLHQNKGLIEDLADCIIPKTDTPGARDTKVAGFIIGMIEYCSDYKTQNNFISGLKKLEDDCINTRGRSFSACTETEKIEILTRLELSTVHKYHLLNRVDNKFFGKPFIVKLKELTVEGYCTSQSGATIGLAYDYLPEAYIPCMNMNSNQKAWATK